MNTILECKQWAMLAIVSLISNSTISHYTYLLHVYLVQLILMI